MPQSGRDELGNRVVNRRKTGTKRGIREGEELAAVDLGSNSFHMVVARSEHGQPRVLDRLRENVRLAAGLHGDGTLDAGYQTRALACLARMGQRIANLPPQHVRAVATHTVRKLRAPQAFLRRAESALGHPIEVVSGREEARLIWQGVAHALPASPSNRLVIDIGGGSTEFVIGRGLDPLQMESVQVGCVASTLHFFPGGRITRKLWESARAEIGLLLQQFAGQYRKVGWNEAWGSSGTVKAIGAIAHGLDPSTNTIERNALAAMRDALINARLTDRIALPGLQAERAPVIAGGVVILEAAFDALGIHRMGVCESAMREGLLWDMLGRAGGHDPRDASVRALAERYGVDAVQARMVERVALKLFDAVAARWRLPDEAREWLIWAARVHEIGLAIAHSQHHRHAGYILRNADMAGFNREEQQMLAALVENQRRKVDRALFTALPARLREPAQRLTALLRLAILLCRARDDQPPRLARISAGPRSLKLGLSRAWKRKHPLTMADLLAERSLLAALGVSLSLTEP
ncbi:MAG: Ppx/GppA phosphatase family protein [Rhodanobacteraceae bacterium]